MKRAMIPILSLVLILSVRAYADEGIPPGYTGPIYIGWPDATFTTHQEIVDKYDECDLEEIYESGDICKSQDSAESAWELVEDVCTTWDDGVCVGAKSDEKMYDEASATSPMTVSCFDDTGSCVVEGGEGVYERDASNRACGPWMGGCSRYEDAYRYCCEVVFRPGSWLPMTRCWTEVHNCRRHFDPWPPP